MTNQEIEVLIWAAITVWITREKLGLEGYITLVDEQTHADGFTAYWNHKTNAWDNNDYADPLSLVILAERPLPDTDYDDDELVSTAASILGKSAGWIRSFQDAFRGFKNRHTSISGYLMGYKIRNRILKELDRKYLAL